MKNFLQISMAVFALLLFTANICFSAADIKDSYDTDIKVFGNWRAYILHLNSKQFVVVEGIRNQIMTFRILLDKHKPIDYFEIAPNHRGYPHRAEEKGNMILTIGDRQYNIPAKLMAYHDFVITFLNNMPSDFINLAKKNKFFFLSYNPNFAGDPINLNGFNEAINYASQLQKRL